MISYTEFVKSCQFFININEKLENNWREVKGDDDLLYLVKQRCPHSHLCFSKSEKYASENDDSLFLKELENELPEDPLCVNKENLNIISIEYHIVYSVSFCVPILYFNIWDSNGKLFSLTEVWKLFAETYPEILKDKWNSITQGLHPHNGKPYFYCHPCNTENVMKFMKKHDTEEYEDVKYYISNWLNIYGGAFGLSVPPKYCCEKYMKTL